MSIIPKFANRRLASLVYRSYGADVFKFERWLRETESWPEAQREAWRLRRLNETIEYCWNHVEFYKEFWADSGLSPRRLESLEELRDFPVLTKDIFRQNHRRARSDVLEGIRRHEKVTGGTTGVPVRYSQDMETWALTQAFHNWGWSQAGYEFGDRAAVVAGGSLVPENLTLKGKLRGWLERKLFLFGVHMDDELAAGHVEKIRRFGARYIYGYPSILSLFATSIRRLDLDPPRLNGIITTAEMLQPQYRTNIEETFNCKVFNHLGCNDGGFMSYECRLHDGLHYCDMLSVLETHGGGDAQTPGGHLLITNLWNRSTPFVRYENGDIVVLGDRPCKCGQKFPLIESVVGRTMDIITFSNGRSLSGPPLTLIFGRMEIDGWQVVQRSRDSLEVRVLCERLSDEDRAHILRVLTHHCGEEVEIAVREVDELEKTKAGKLKPVWSEVI